MNVILTIFIAGIVIFILWFVIVLRTGLPSTDQSARDVTADSSGSGRKPPD